MSAKLDPSAEALKTAPFEEKAHLVTLFIKKMSETYGRFAREMCEDLTGPCVHLIEATDAEVRPMLNGIPQRARREIMATLRVFGHTALTDMFEAIYGPDKLAVFTMLLAEEMDQMRKRHPNFMQYLKQKPKTENSMSTDLVVNEKNSKLIDTATAAMVLQNATMSELIQALLCKGDDLEEKASDLESSQTRIKKALDDFDGQAKAARTSIQQLVDSANKDLSALSSTVKEQASSIAEGAKSSCAQIANAVQAACTDRAAKLETDCLARVEAVEAQFKTAVDTITKECAQRAESAEQETLLCIERADQAVASANALGASFNTLNERLHELEISMRTFFRSGMSPAPIYSPVATSAPAVPMAVQLPTLASASELPPKAAPTNVVPMKTKQRNEDDGHKMTFALLGLHQKNVEHIMQRLRKPTARHVELIVVENTATDKLPKHADYCIVSGDHDLSRRWAFCLETYGLTKCVRLNNGSVVSFREKIEELYEAHHPINAPTNLASVGHVLSKAM